jgi:hypothetical protein
MKVLDTGSKKWSKKVKCRECKAKLEIEEEDLKAGNFAIGHAGETWEPELYVECAVCNSDVRLKFGVVPSGIEHKLFEELRKRLGV